MHNAHIQLQWAKVLGWGITHTHSLLYYVRLLFHTFEHVHHIILLDGTVGGHLHVVIRSTHHCCRRWERGTQAGMFPTNRMSCSAVLIYMSATTGYVWYPVRWNMTYLLTLTQNLFQWISEYDIKRETKRVMGFSADWFIYFTAYFLCVFVRLNTANATKPTRSMSVQLSAKSRCFQGSQHSGIPNHYQAFFHMWSSSWFLASSLCMDVLSFLSLSLPFQSFILTCHPLSRDS